MSSRQFLDSGKGHFWYHEATLIVALRRQSASDGGSGGKVLKEAETDWEREGNAGRGGGVEWRLRRGWSGDIIATSS